MKTVPMNKTSLLIRFLNLIAILLALPSGYASAALRGCRTDPIFRLSNGEVITITLNIDTQAHNISNIHYVLHLPAGVAVKNVAYSGGLRQAMKETYVVYQGGPAKTYTTDTVLTTVHPAQTALVAITRLSGILAKSASGFSGDYLIITLVRP